MADLKINIGATDNASSKVNQVASSTEKLAVAQGKMTASTEKAKVSAAGATAGFAAMAVSLASVVNFARDAAQAFMDDEKSMTRLRFATGALADSFAEYASTLQNTTGANEDSTRVVQAMLHQYGVAPEAINKATKALVDYAAISGTDVKQAAEELIKGADGGRAAFRELGLVYEEAATKTEMVANITDALAKKMGGGAGADAGSLSHSVRMVQVQWGEFTESIGGFFDAVEKRTHVLRTFSIGLREFAGDLQRLRGDLAPGGAPAPDMASSALDNLITARLVGPGGRPAVDRSKVDDDQLTKKAREGREAARKKWLEDRAKILRDSQRSAREVAEALAQGEDMQLKATQAFLDEQDEAREAAHEQERQDIISALALRNRIETDAYEQRKALKQREAEEAKYWGDAIGGAFASALASQLNRLASGGELSPEETVVDVFTGIASVALSAAGAGWAAPLVGAAGSFAKSQLAKKHGGGWVGAPRFHNGAWIGQDERPAILQTGERVLSRSEVASMGGPSGVDSAARGAVSITVNTLDGSTARDYFTRAGGRALVNAVRTGRGSIGAFGRG